MVQAVEKESIKALSCKQIPAEPFVPSECERRDAAGQTAAPGSADFTATSFKSLSLESSRCTAPGCWLV